MKLSKAQLKRIIQEETKNLRKEGFMDWFKGKKKEEPTSEPEPSADTEQEAYTIWEALVEEFNEVYRGATDGIPHTDDCRTMDCEKHLKNFWAMWDKVNPARQYGRLDEFVKAYVDGGIEAAQDLVHDKWRFSDKGFVHILRKNGTWAVNEEYVKDLDLAKRFAKGALDDQNNPRQPEPESSDDDEYEWRGGDYRRRHRERTPGGGYGLTRENSVTKKDLMRIIQQEIKLLKNRKGNI